MKDNQLIDFTLVYNKHKKRLYNYLLRITQSSSLAEDILHNTFIKLYENAERIQDLEKIEYWLFNTARNEAMSQFRRIHHMASLEQAESVPAADDLISQIEINEIRSVIMDELNKMDVAQSEVFLLKEYSGMTYREVASIMHISEDLVKSRLFKTREKLKDVVSKLCRGDK
jgi:RNA polymerase sigma-70 factor (ECF subfamily)